MLLITSRYFTLVQTCLLFLFVLYVVGVLDPQTIYNYTFFRSDLRESLYSTSTANPQEPHKDVGQHDETNLGSDSFGNEDNEHKSNGIDQVEAESPPVPIDEEPNHHLFPDLFSKARTIIPSILDPEDTSIDRMSCPPINTTRYSDLRPMPFMRIQNNKPPKRKYIFALNLHQCVDILPHLMGSIVEAIKFLGPQHCGVSIVEGNSDDGTLEVLRLLQKELTKLGVAFWLSTSSLNPNEGPDRIKYLALLRNMALEPVIGVPKSYNPPITKDDMEMARASLRHFRENGNDYPDPSRGNHNSSQDAEIDTNTTILFINDILPCAEDLLELLHQLTFQRADMACAMDWRYTSETDPQDSATFYDVWVSRTLTGDLFFDIPPSTGSWEHSHTLFPSDPPTKSWFNKGLPFQVFSCWNGAVAFSSRPLLQAQREVRFRWPMEPECFQGEPQLFCKDLWWNGFGRIAVVPSVNLGYTDVAGRRIKREKGYVSDFVKKEGHVDVAIDWRLEPPERVKCTPDFKTQSWLRWNESLAG
ncbi:cryptococcal mannosyltransferase 1 domain containing protein [Naviculisporaceae sp. PSN 640]